MKKKMWNQKNMKIGLGLLFGAMCIWSVNVAAYAEEAGEATPQAQEEAAVPEEGEAAGQTDVGATPQAIEEPVSRVDTIPKGIWVNGIDLSGKPMESLRSELENIAGTLQETQITLQIGENEVPVSAESLGMKESWEAAEEKIKSVGSKGNIVVRYKELKDVEREPMMLQMDMSWDEEKMAAKLVEVSKPFEQAAVDFGLVREGGSFSIIDGATGYEVAKDEAKQTILDTLGTSWNGEPATIALHVVESQPKGSREELAKVKDLLGESTTNYGKAVSGRTKNIERASSLVNGTLLYPGEEYSVAKGIAPITAKNGYFTAPNYVSGEVVDGIGGGVCQVSTTLYGALLNAEIEITERSNHSMTVTYVEPAMDAAIAGDYKDLKFKNNQNTPIYIEALTSGGNLTFRVWGLETRPSNRRIEYKSVVLDRTESSVQLTANWGAPAGTITTTNSPHSGCVAKMIKRVYENDVLVSESDVNKSSYRMTPKKISIGMATDNPDLSAALQAAVSAQSLDSVEQALATYGFGVDSPAGDSSVPAAAPAAQTPQAPAAQTPADPAAQTPEASVPNAEMP